MKTRLRSIRAAVPVFALTLLAAASLGAATRTLSYANVATHTGGGLKAGAFSNDGNGSLRLSTAVALPLAGVNQDKVAVLFGTGSPLGKLGTLTTFKVDAFRSSTPATTSNAGFAFRPHFANGDAPVYGTRYDGSSVASDVLRSLGLVGGNFGNNEKATNTNQSSASGTKRLNSLAELEESEIVGVSVASGSGLGAFSGYVDHLELTFAPDGELSTFIGDVTAASSVPVPAAAMGGIVLMGMLGARRNRQPA